MKKSSNNLFWIISLIIVGVAAYWFGTAQVTAPQENIITPTETEKTVAESDQQKNITIPSDLEKKFIYTNEKYHFTLQLPERWKEYTIKERKDEWGDHYSFELQLKNGQYNSVFTVSAFSREVWKALQAEEGPKAQYLSEKNAYVFGYSIGHDDEGYAGFPDVVPELIYKGPFFDVQEIIIPSFAFTE